MVTILDGGLATTLQAAGHDVEGHSLWSAHLLSTQPRAIVDAHAQFIEAGADVVITASYQASVQNLQQHLQLSVDEAISLMKDSVTLAREAAQASGREVRVAGSVGPYGACLGDGSEYTGNYLATMDRTALKEWHRPRVSALVAAGADLLAVETLPGPAEALAVLDLLREYPNTPAWVTFSCQDSRHTCDGSSFSEAAAAVCAARPDALLAVGVNCTAPDAALQLLSGLDRRRVPLPLVVYPNSGELWVDGRFTGDRRAELATMGPRYRDAGATYIGGCCRVGPDQIRGLRDALRGTGDGGKT
ncbi:Homocysteine S-methyltransferase 1 [Amphibalanus amphitrite]|uniref:Homocysteine S-methyltransferase 1 n=1 Tax=Amphibalanus amphitrite TaxID=1232801 RepID=A0A6A4X3U7_AMPAM|nr:Homocysteine S-methyltransferase 1 [Amphibalanus amphitrite]